MEERTTAEKGIKRKHDVNSALSHKMIYEARKDAGLCTRCGKEPHLPGILKCEKCRLKRSEYYRAFVERRSESGCCLNCGKKMTDADLGVNGKKRLICAECTEFKRVKERLARR